MEKSKVLLIYTGGTIGMIEDPKTGVLIPFDFEHLHQQIPELSRINAQLSVESLSESLDSSDMHPNNWKEMAMIIEKNYNSFDGFVILHGTDTMAYTASALSFMLQGIKKPVILTGSQLPVGTIRTDGKENLITSIEIAACKDQKGESIIQEVAVYFEYSLYRGNRTTKVSANAFEAFLSPNYRELAVAGIDIDYHVDAFLRTSLSTPCFRYEMDEKVALMKIYPGFSVKVYQELFDVNLVDAVVIESFGAGNIPNSSDLHKMIENYIQAGGIVINITQCYSGKVAQGKYANSVKLKELGVISGSDLTTEAAITKIMFLLGNYSDKEQIKTLMQHALVGEMTL
ncbi:MAG: asparaginase [Brumimicrobium sp.]|nr:asparaginase [Brumimicrobium sp.]